MIFARKFKEQSRHDAAGTDAGAAVSVKPSSLRDKAEMAPDRPLKPVSFAVGTGRCGTKFLYRLLDLEPHVSAVHERNPLNETFHRYCKWYGLPVDSEGFLHVKRKEIDADLATAGVSFESSAYLSMSVVELYERFGARFILLVRKPQEVVNSYLRKGWYDKPVIRADAHLAPSYQESKRFHHFLGRVTPTGDKFTEWQNMSRVGKLAWYWNALNERVLEQLGRIPQDHWKIQKLEDFSYERYVELTRFLGIAASVPQAQFESLAASRPNTLGNVPSLASWDETQISEFEREVRPMAEHFGYEYRVDRLRAMMAEQRMLDRATAHALRKRGDNGVLTSIRKLFKAR